MLFEQPSKREFLAQISCRRRNDRRRDGKNFARAKFLRRFIQVHRKETVDALKRNASAARSAVDEFETDAQRGKFAMQWRARVRDFENFFRACVDTAKTRD